MTTEEMVDFDYWRQVRMGRSRQRFFTTSGIEPWNFGPRRPQKSCRCGKYLRAS